MLDGAIWPRRYCVYLHKARGEVFYVGRGSLDRPFSRDGRNQKWRDLVQEVGKYDLEVQRLTDDEETAKAEEIRLIQALAPSCNVQRYPRAPQVALPVEPAAEKESSPELPPCGFWVLAGEPDQDQERPINLVAKVSWPVMNALRWCMDEDGWGINE